MGRSEWAIFIERFVVVVCVCVCVCVCRQAGRQAQGMLVCTPWELLQDVADDRTVQVGCLRVSEHYEWMLTERLHGLF